MSESVLHYEEEPRFANPPKREVSAGVVGLCVVEPEILAEAVKTDVYSHTVGDAEAERFVELNGQSGWNRYASLADGYKTKKEQTVLR